MYFFYPKNDHQIEFTFLHVNDVYEIAPIQNGNFGGMARLETIHKELLEQNDNTILVMAGDFLNPSLLGSLKHKGKRISGSQMIEVMNAMNFDYAAFGNHEFDLKKEELQQRINESNFTWLSSNTFLKENDSVKRFYKYFKNHKEEIFGSVVKELKDSDGTKIKIGIITTCIDSNPNQYVQYTSVYDGFVKEYDKIAEKVDLVFGLTHLSLNQDSKISQLAPDVYLIMGGHEHDAKDKKAGNTIIRKADANAKSAYIHKISFNTKTKKTTLNSELKLLDNTIKPDFKIDSIVKKWTQIQDNQISQIVTDPYNIIYNAKIPLIGIDKTVRFQQTNLGEIIAQSMSYSFQNQVDCALVNGGSLRLDDTLIGEINSVDIFRVLPFGGSVYKLKIKGRLLEKVLDYGELSKGKGAYLQRFNIEIKDKKWIVNKKPLNPEKVYAVAISDYLIRGLDIPFLTENNQDIFSVYKPTREEISFDIRKSVIEYLKTLK